MMFQSFKTNNISRTSYHIISYHITNSVSKVCNKEVTIPLGRGNLYFGKG